ncbi:MAG: hypothetical protein ACO3EZ_00550 [Prochlorotrichaceae cyanobacterium]
MTLSSTLPAGLNPSNTILPKVSKTQVVDRPRGADFHPYRLLEIHLQRQWQQRRRSPIPLQIRCSYQSDRLLILIEHAAGVRPDPRFTLAQFAAALQQLEGKLHHALFQVPAHKTTKLRVGLYLRVLGETQPYAAGGSTLVPPPLRRPVAKPEAGQPPQVAPNATPTPTAKTISVPQSSPLNPEGLGLSSGVWLTGAALCLSTFVGSFWFMMQPCYVQPCTPLHKAEQLKANALAQIATAENWDQLKAIEIQLTESQDLSRKVPLWSSYRQRAKDLQAEVNTNLAAFAPITSAFETAVQAVEQSKTPPYPLEQWQATRDLWVQALDILRSIPQDNPSYELAQRKIEQYEGYVKLVDRELEREVLGQSILKKAEESAKLAQLQKGNWEKALANDPSVDRTVLWERIQRHWQTALETLNNIPEDTTAYHSIADYRQRYQEEYDRFQQQSRSATAANNAYLQALDKARLAESAEQEARWDIARNRWEVALVTLQQVPTGSPQYEEAQKLLPIYTQAYQRAEQQAQKFNQVEQTRQELGKICTTTPVICYFTVTPELIAVQVTVDYESQILAAGLWGDQQQALEHLQGLENALKVISDKAQIPLELYDPDGAINSRYVPTPN